jgi:hypothetical protein
MINTKLQSIIDTKSAIGNAIVNKGGTITGETPFFNYAAQIDGLATGATIDGYDESKVYIVANSSINFPTTNISVNNGFAYTHRFNNVISKFYAGNLVFDSNITGTGYTTNSILINNGYIYTGGGNATISNIRRFHESNGVLDISSEAYGNTVRALALNNGYLYAVGSGATANIRRYHEGNLVFDINSASYGNLITTMAINNGIVYIAGSNQTGVNRGVGAYHESNLTLITNSANLSGVATSMRINNGFVYVGYDGGIRKYHEGNLGLVGSISLSDDTFIETTNGFLQAFTIIGGGTTIISKYYESNLALLLRINYIVNAGVAATTKYNNLVYIGCDGGASQRFIYSFITNTGYTNISNTPYYLVPKE